MVTDIPVDDFMLVNMNEDWEKEKYAVILLCTDKESYMKTYNPFQKNCDIIEITEEDDFTSGFGYEKVLNAIKTLSLIHISEPTRR